MFKAYLVSVSEFGAENYEEYAYPQSLEVAERQAQELCRIATRRGDNILDYGIKPVNP